MGENQPNGAAAAQQPAPTMQLYREEQARLRQMLDKRAAIARRLANIESEIESKETAYLDSTPNGNIIAGFDNYIKGTGAAAQRRKAGATEQNRVFSRSSISYRPGSVCHPSTMNVGEREVINGFSGGYHTRLYACFACADTVVHLVQGWFWLESRYAHVCHGFQVRQEEQEGERGGQ